MEHNPMEKRKKLIPASLDPNQISDKPRLPRESIAGELLEAFKLAPDEFGALFVSDNKQITDSEDDLEVVVYANSLESNIGYSALVRILSKIFGSQMAYFRSEKGGALSPEDARNAAFQNSFDETEAIRSIKKLLTKASNRITFSELYGVHQDSPRIAENLWTLIKREARTEFETGNLTAEVFDCADYLNEAWNRASYLGIRESLIEEWQPKGGIELSMIDMIAQTFLQFQYWLKESIKRSRTKPRVENQQFARWKELRKLQNEKQWNEGEWDLPTVEEKIAIEQAAQMTDRWQRMYFRAVRSLRDFRRHSPVTINQPQQVNIASEGGRQINVNKTNGDQAKEISS